MEIDGGEGYMIHKLREAELDSKGGGARRGAGEECFIIAPMSEDSVSVP